MGALGAQWQQMAGGMPPQMQQELQQQLVQQQQQLQLQARAGGTGRETLKVHAESGEAVPGAAGVGRGRGGSSV